MPDSPAALPLESDPADVVLLAEQTALLLADAGRLDAAALAAPSRCVGWTRAHVLAHLAGNARALANLVTSVEGTPTPMYASQQARDAAIEAGARTDRVALLSDLQAACDELAARLGALAPAALSASAAGPGVNVRGDQVATLRLRKVVYHHVDLDCGFSFADAPTDLVRRFLAAEVDGLRADPASPSLGLRTNERDGWSIGDGRPTVSAPRAAMLAWLARGDASDIEAPPARDLPALPQHPTDDQQHPTQEAPRP